MCDLISSAATAALVLGEILFPTFRFAACGASHSCGYRHLAIMFYVAVATKVGSPAHAAQRNVGDKDPSQN